jgi:hypothetical protein
VPDGRPAATGSTAAAAVRGNVGEAEDLGVAVKPERTSVLTGCSTSLAADQSAGLLLRVRQSAGSPVPAAPRSPATTTASRSGAPGPDPDSLSAIWSHGDPG